MADKGVSIREAAQALSRRPRVAVSHSRYDIAAVALLAAVVSVWTGIADGSFSFGVLLACESAFFAFYFAGSLFAGWKALSDGVRFDFPLRLLLGYCMVNTSLLGLAWLSPFGIITNFCALLALITLASLFFTRPVKQQDDVPAARLWLAALCIVATSLWCQDSIRPISEQGDSVVFKPWIDGFYHSIHIRMFGAGHGAASLEDFRMAGIPVRPYHYGAYLLPALVKQLSSIDSYTAFAGIQAPIGVLFTGLAAYAFFASWWGTWSGLGAAAVLLLFADGAQQGGQNPFMSYHWLTQISPSATYGLALLAVAWLFVIQGTVRGNRVQLLAGWLLAGVVAFYKLHYVIANALPLLLIPALFFQKRLELRQRALWVAAACAGYVVAIHFGQKVPGVPLIRLDGSSNGEILRLVLSFAKPGELRDYVSAHMGPQFPWTSNLLFGVPYVLFAALGSLLLFFVALTIQLRGRATLLYRIFPLLLLLNFLVMFFGLALDFASSTPDELSQRPLMIVYFFFASWVGGALAFQLGQQGRSISWARALVIAGTVLLLGVPAIAGRGVQLMWAMPRLSPVRLPTALLHAAQYLREHSAPDDVFQDSQFDRGYAVAALAERRSFVSHTLTRMSFRSEEVETRSAAIDRFMAIREPKLLRATARALGFQWFLLEPGDRVDWPVEIVSHPAFKEGSLALYRF